MLAFLTFQLTKLYLAAPTPTPTSCTLPGSGQNSFFGFPHWWKYLNGQLDPLNKCVPVVSFPGGIWSIGLAILDMLLRLAGFAAVISIIVAGISYIAAAGSADQITAARKRIVNSLVGLLIVIVAAATVSFIGNRLG